METIGKHTDIKRQISGQRRRVAGRKPKLPQSCVDVLVSHGVYRPARWDPALHYRLGRLTHDEACPSLQASWQNGGARLSVCVSVSAVRLLFMSTSFSYRSGGSSDFLSSWATLSARADSESVGRRPVLGLTAGEVFRWQTADQILKATSPTSGLLLRFSAVGNNSITKWNVKNRMTRKVALSFETIHIEYKYDLKLGRAHKYNLNQCFENVRLYLLLLAYLLVSRTSSLFITILKFTV